MALDPASLRSGDKVMIPAIVLGISKEPPGEVQLEIPSETAKQPYRIHLVGVPLEALLTDPVQD